MSLVELLIGLAVASMVAAIAVTSLSMAGITSARKLAEVRTEHSMWFALAAVSRDLRAAPLWKGCIGTDHCEGHLAHRPSTAIIAGDVRWSADDALWRCERNHCDKYLEGVSAAMFVADIPDANGRASSRSELSQAHGDHAEVVEVIFWTNDGRSYERTTKRAGHAR